MKGDSFSNAVFPSWMRVSLYGLSISVAAVVVGGWGRHLLEGNVSSVAISGRIAAAAVYGFGLGFSALFLMLVVAGGLYAALRRRHEDNRDLHRRRDPHRPPALAASRRLHRARKGQPVMIDVAARPSGNSSSNRPGDQGAAVMIIDREDAFEIDDADMVVETCQRDSSGLRLELHSPDVIWTLVIGGAVSVTRSAKDDGLIPSTSPVSNLVGNVVLLLRARKADGELEIRFTHDLVLTVEPDPDYEAWEIYSTRGERLIAVPGDGIAKWGRSCAV
jgi:hypothetical protein